MVIAYNGCPDGARTTQGIAALRAVAVLRTYLRAAVWAGDRRIRVRDGETMSTKRANIGVIAKPF